MSNSTKPDLVSKSSARTVIVSGLAMLAGIGLILQFIDDSTASRALAGLLLLVLLLIFGAGLTSVAIIGPNSKLKITWNQFAIQSLDMALMPVTLPVLMVACLWVGTNTVSCLARPFFSGQLLGMLGFQFGWFVVLTTMPYWLFIWPIFNRAKHSVATNAFLLAPNTCWVICGLVLYSVVVAFNRPTLALFLVSCISSCFFCAVYHWILWPRFPRFNTILLSSQNENGG